MELKEIPTPNIDKRADNWSDYFKKSIEYDNKLGIKPLKPLGKPCKDCAVLCGLYHEISDALKNESEEIQKLVSERWFCHNNPNRSCQGNLDHLLK